MRVVHVKQHPFTHYIGRGWMPKVPTGKQQPLHTNLGNPFVITAAGPYVPAQTREDVIRLYEGWARSEPKVLERIRALPEDAVLGCWCKPHDCHGDVIAKLWKELNGLQP